MNKAVMFNLKKYIALIFLFLCLNTNANSQSTNECKYLMVLNYLHTNSKINESIKMFFPKLISKKEKFVEFNLSDIIDFISISPFKDNLKDSSMLSNSDMKDPNLFFKKYYFESYTSDFLKNIIEL